MPEELLAHRIKRLRMRSMRRGIKEMDLILSAFADTHLADLDIEQLYDYDEMLNENDHDLYRWVTGQEAPPERFSPLISRISKTFQR